MDGRFSAGIYQCISDSSRKREAPAFSDGNACPSTTSQLSSLINLSEFQLRQAQEDQASQFFLSSYVPKQNAQNSFPMNTLTANPDFGNDTRGTSLSRSFYHKGYSTVGSSSVVEIPRLPYSQHFTYNVASQKEPVHATGNTSQKNFMDSNFGSQYIPECISAINRKMPLENVSLDRIHVPELNNAGISIEHTVPSAIVNVSSSSGNLRSPSMCIPTTVNQVEGAISVPTNNVIGDESASEIGNTEGSSVDKQFDNACSGRLHVDCSTHEKFFDSVHFLGDPASKNPKVQDDVDIKTINSLKNKSSHEKVDNLAVTPHESSDVHASLNLSGKSKLLGRKPASTVVSKLWNGILQLNTSTTVSVIAFFKSGEKMSDINWTHFVEVKGKVKLEAFEKFIQEFPRSRSRALMVISLCWKPGSSEAGLEGIKEVARGYKDGQRVGFAQISPGTDLYVCPRSDTIITILAKYGFFKGTTAVEEDQHSLIGCVIWKRNRASTTAILKNSEVKNVPLEKKLDSTTFSSPHNVENFSSTKVCESEIKHVDLQERGEMVPSQTSCQTMVLPASAGITFASTGIVSTAIAAINTLGSTTPFILPNLQLNHKHTSSIPSLPTNSSLVSIEHTSRNQLPTLHCAELAKSDIDFDLQQSNISETPEQASEAVNSCCPEYDDLPEFDFDSACGAPHPLEIKIPWPNQHIDLPSYHPYDKILTVELKDSEGKSNITTMDIISAQEPSSLVLGPNANKAEHLGFEGRPAACATILSNKFDSPQDTEAPSSKGRLFKYSGRILWEEEDDMPEWCPPDEDGGNRQDHVPLPPPFLSILPAQLTHDAMLPSILHKKEMESSRVLVTSPPLMFVNSRGKKQDFPLEYDRGLFGQGPDNKIKMSDTSRCYQPDLKYSAGSHSHSNLRHQHIKFNQWTSKKSTRLSHTQDSRHLPSGFDLKIDYQKTPSCLRSRESSRWKRTGFDKLPEYPTNISSRSPPEGLSRRRRPSLFDVKPDAINGDRKH